MHCEKFLFLYSRKYGTENDLSKGEEHVLISKNIQIEFADSSIKAIDAIHDIIEGVKSASLNLYSRHGVRICHPMICGKDKVVVEMKIPEEIIDNFSIGPHLKGISNYLLKNCNGRYSQYRIGKRLLKYTEVPSPDTSDNYFRMEDRLEAVDKFARLLKRSDEDAMDSIRWILVILKNAENKS